MHREWRPNMSNLKQNREIEDVNNLHDFYMTIINTVPNLVYWVDAECNLIGCNKAFVQLLGLNKLKCNGITPYEQLVKFTDWEEKRIDQLKLDDMHVIFSGEPHYNKDEQPVKNKEGVSLYFQSTRVPIYDQFKKITGLVVSLTDVTALKTLEPQGKPQKPVSVPVENKFMGDHVTTILMIEDNIIAQCIEKALLTSLHCEVDIADSEADALKLFNPGKYDLVLMDLGLENSSGYVVAKKLRQKEQNTQYHVPIIALTSYDADTVKADCEQYFMEGAITKPLTSEQAEQIIKHYIYHIDIPVQGLKHS